MNSSAIRIPLRVSNKRAYVWSVDDIATIRAQHRICGILTGTLPHLSQQNVFLGVPLELMPEEAVLLVENGVAVFIDDRRAHNSPSYAKLQKWGAEQQDFIKQQIELAEAKLNKQSAGHATSEEAQRKRREREERKRVEAAKLSAARSSLSDISIPVPSTPKRAVASGSAPDGDNKPSSSASYNIVVPALSTEYEWYDDSACAYTTAKAAIAAGIWHYPATLQERARCGVFRGLWSQGYFLGGGIKFGGEYLVYPGDPLRYHSHFVASVLESPSSKLRPMEIVAHGRLGTATKKAHLLCSWDDEKKEASYLSIEWAGFG